MKANVIELKEHKGVLQIEDTNLYFVNTLRRVMISELPKLAIDEVIIYDNTSPLFDEIISHRLGLIPLPTDLRLFTFRDECKCEGKGCPICTVRYTLSKEGPAMIHSGDLQPEHDSYKIKDSKIPIAELAQDQRIILEVEAVLGKGKDHAKWQSVIAPSYRMKTSIEFDKKHTDDAKEFITLLPKDLVELKGNALILKDINKLPVLESYIDQEDISFITISKDPTKFIFTYETDGSLNAKDALDHSLEIIAAKYKEFATHVNKIK